MAYLSNPHLYDDCPPFLREFLFYMKTIKGRSVRTVDAYYVDLRTFLRYIKSIKIPAETANSVQLLQSLSETQIEDFPVEILQTITMQDVYEFLNYVMTTRENSAKTRCRKVSAIRSMFEYLCSKTQILNENPVRNLELPSTRKALPKYLTLEESYELLAAVEQTGTKDYERDYCMITLFLNCGMRLSELVDINLHSIRDNSLKLLGKGNKERIIYLNEACLQALDAYLKVRKPPTKEEHKNALFLSSHGSRISARRVEQIIEQCLKAARLDGKGYSPHKLRHTAATLMYQHGGVDIRVLKEILGHSNLGTTEIYTHVSDTQLEKAADRSPLSHVHMRKGKKIAEAETVSNREK